MGGEEADGHDAVDAVRQSLCHVLQVLEQLFLGWEERGQRSVTVSCFKLGKVSFA